MDYVNFNGKILLRQSAAIQYDNRSFRFGDGLFETMRFHGNNIQLWDLHSDRLSESLNILKMVLPGYWERNYFKQQIEETCDANNLQNARIRLTVYRGNGSLKNALSCTPGFLIESWNEEWFPSHLAQKGLHVDVYNDAIKSCDTFSSIKSNNFTIRILNIPKSGKFS